MKRLAILFMTSILFIGGCAKEVIPDQTSNEEAPIQHSVNSFDPNNIDESLVDAYVLSEIQSAYMSNYFKGVSISNALSIQNLLKTLSQKQKPLTHFSAELLDIEKKDEHLYELTIDRIELNSNYQPSSALNDEPFYKNAEVRKETITIDDGVLFTIHGGIISVDINDKLIDYLKSLREPNEPLDIFDFYQCEDEIVAVLNIYRV